MFSLNRDRYQIPSVRREQSRVLGRLAVHRNITLFVAVYWFALVVLGVGLESPKVTLYAAVFAAMVCLVLRIDAAVGLDQRSIRALAVLGLLHMAGGILPVGPGRVLYHVRLLPILRYDQLVHLAAGAIITLAFTRVISDRGPDWINRRAVAGTAVGLSLALEALNEITEFIASLLYSTNVGDYRNTGWDLVFSLAGALWGAAWWLRSSRGETGL